MTIKQAKKKAISKGYDKVESQEAMFLNPKFWWCLGEALGGGIVVDANDDPHAFWQSIWHRFISHLSGYNKAESYFKNLSE